MICRKCYTFSRGLCECEGPLPIPAVSWPLAWVLAVCERVHETCSRENFAQFARAMIETRYYSESIEPSEETRSWLTQMQQADPDTLTDDQAAVVLVARRGWVGRDTLGPVVSSFRISPCPASSSSPTQPIEEASGQFFGEPGQRLNIPDCQCTEQRSLGENPEHPEWGERFLIRFVEPGGAELVWFASAGGRFDPKPGGTYNLRCTIVNHAAHAGKRNTIVNRCEEFDPVTGKSTTPRAPRRAKS